MKKLIFSFMTMSIVICSAIIPSFAKTERNSVDLVKLIQENNNSDVTIIFHETVQDYIHSISNDENLTQDVKDFLIEDAYRESRERSNDYIYSTLRFDVTVTNLYHCYPYFYTKFYYPSQSVSPDAMVEVKYANIDRDYQGVSKQFSGTLYYNLETSRKLYWDLNGDFYDNGTTTISSGISIPVGGTNTATFSVSYASNHYKYIHYSKTYSF